MKFNKSKNQTGFTVIELLAAMAVLVIILSLMANMFAGAVGAWEKGSGQASRSGNARMVMDLMAREIEQMVVDPAMPWAKASFDPGGPLSFDQMFFATLAGDADDGRSIKYVGYRVIEDSSTRDYTTYRLMRHERDFTEQKAVAGTGEKPFEPFWYTDFAGNGETLLWDIVRFDLYLHSGDVHPVPGGVNFGRNSTAKSNNEFTSHNRDNTVKYPEDQNLAAPYVDIFIMIATSDAMIKADKLMDNDETRALELLTNESTVLVRRVYPRMRLAEENHPSGY